MSDHSYNNNPSSSSHHHLSVDAPPVEKRVSLRTAKRELESLAAASSTLEGELDPATQQELYARAEDIAKEQARLHMQGKSIPPSSSASPATGASSVGVATPNTHNTDATQSDSQTPHSSQLAMNRSYSTGSTPSLTSQVEAVTALSSMFQPHTPMSVGSIHMQRANSSERENEAKQHIGAASFSGPTKMSTPQSNPAGGFLPQLPSHQQQQHIPLHPTFQQPPPPTQPQLHLLSPHGVMSAALGPPAPSIGTPLGAPTQALGTPMNVQHAALGTPHLPPYMMFSSPYPTIGMHSPYSPFAFFPPQPQMMMMHPGGTIGPIGTSPAMALPPGMVTPMMYTLAPPGALPPATYRSPLGGVGVLSPQANAAGAFHLSPVHAQLNAVAAAAASAVAQMASSVAHHQASAQASSLHSTSSAFTSTRLPILFPKYLANKRNGFPTKPVPILEDHTFHEMLDESSSHAFESSLRELIEQHQLKVTPACIPLDDLTTQPTFVNQAQYARYIHRLGKRKYHAMLTHGKHGHGTVKHLSRQLHAARRVRGKGGRFLTKEEKEALIKQEAEGGGGAGGAVHQEDEDEEHEMEEEDE